MGNESDLRQDYLISTDKKMLQIAQVKAMLTKTYWAQDRLEDVIRKSIENSLAYGIYYKNDQVGFARVITDYATAFYICDVVIDESCRGIGLGKKLIRAIVDDERLKNLRGILMTRDAQGLYQQYGFIKSGDRFMYREQRA